MSLTGSATFADTMSDVRYLDEIQIDIALLKCDIARHSGTLTLLGLVEGHNDHELPQSVLSVT